MINRVKRSAGKRRVDDGRVRLLLFTNSVQIGGMEEHVRLIAKDIDPTLFEVSVVFPDWEATNWFASRLSEFVDVELITPDRRPGGPGVVREARRLAQYARRHRIQVAHLHSTTYAGQLVAVAALKLAGVARILVTEHLAPDGPVPFEARIRRRLLGALVDGVICVSERNRVTRSKYLHSPASTTYVVDNGIDVDRFDEPAPPRRIDAIRVEHGLTSAHRVVGSAIRLEPGKGLADLVDAFALVHSSRPDTRLMLVGDGSLRLELEAQVAERGLSDVVIFTGFVFDPRAHIELIDVFVLPVPVGSASIGLLEAMAMAKPCVISFGGEGEAVVPGESGYWAEPFQPASIAEFVGRLVDDPDERERFGRAARQRVETHFSSRRVADELRVLYLGG
jgi:glycosyltransferase involved in cell wall biosynthesis